MYIYIYVYICLYKLVGFDEQMGETYLVFGFPSSNDFTVYKDLIAGIGPKGVIPNGFILVCERV